MDAPERRRSQRILFTSTAILRYGSKELSLEVKVDTRDISLQGVFLETGNLLPVTTPCDIEIHLIGTTSTMDFHAQGVVQRHESNGMAIAFTHLDPDSYLHILNLVKLHAVE
jgi:hypothetical protein